MPKCLLLLINESFDRHDKHFELYSNLKLPKTEKFRLYFRHSVNTVKKFIGIVQLGSYYLVR